MKVAMIGTGLQAERRSQPFFANPDDQLVFVASSNADRGAAFAKRFGCESGTWQEAIARDDIEAIVICTTPDTHYDITAAALAKGKHVLCEKPLTLTSQQSYSLFIKAKQHQRVLKCGFNHRHHPALAEAKKLVESGALGKLISGRCVYGICGREGYENEWRVDREKSAGGQLMELGIHGLDLFRWYFGEFSTVQCVTGNLYFQTAPYEDNAFVMLRAESGALCSLHTSLTQWKNTFQLDLVGSEGYATISGLGSSYGEQKLIYGKKDFTAPFQDTVTYFRGGDKSWANEWMEFKAAIQENREPIGNAEDGFKAILLVETCYQAARSDSVQRLAS